MKTYYPVVQALRGLASALVCVYHFVAYSDFRGALFEADAVLLHIARACTGSVFVFFVLSAFVLPMSLLKEDQWKGFSHFVLRRLIRIELPYIASIAMILAVEFFFAYRNHTEFNWDTERLLHHLTYSIPFTHWEWYNVIYWTLAIECQFYILVGIFFALRSRGWVGWNKALLFGFAVSACGVEDHRWIFHYSFLFALGIGYMLMRMGHLTKSTALVVLTLAAVGVGYRHGGQAMVYAVLTLVAIAYADRAWPVLSALGEMSYSFYLTHGLTGGHVLYFFSRNCESTVSKIGLVAVAFIVSLLCARMFWKIVEVTTHRWAKEWSRRQMRQRLCNLLMPVAMSRQRPKSCGVNPDRKWFW